MDSCSLFLLLLTFFGGYDLYISTEYYPLELERATRPGGPQVRVLIDVALFGTKFRALEHVMWRDYSSLRQSMPFIVHVKWLYNFHYLPLHQSGISRVDQAGSHR